MATDDLLCERSEEILRIAARHGAHNVSVFGSAALKGLRQLRSAIAAMLPPLEELECELVGEDELQEEL